MPPPESSLAPFRTQTFRDILVQSSYPAFRAQLDGLLDASHAKVADLEAQVTALTQERDRELMRIAALKYAAAPVRKLPPEMLVEIFVRALWAAEKAAKNDSSAAKATLQMAYRLCSVCNYWRQLILQTRRMWTGPLHIIACGDSTSLEFIENLISRSAPQSLRLVLQRTKHWDSDSDDYDSPFRGNYGWDAISKPIVAAVVAVADRWRSLQSNFDPARYYEPHQIPIFERLERVALDFDGEEWLGHETSIVSPFTMAPRLVDVSLASLELVGAPIPWTQLTTLSLRFCNDDEHPLSSLDAIAKCTSLVRLQLCTSAWSFDDAPDQSNDKDTLLRVEEVRLSFTIYHGSTLVATVHPFFERFAFPKLSLLEIGFDELMPLPPALGTFLDSSPHIHRFALRSAKLGHLALEDMLPRLESATSLSFTDCSWTDSANLYQKLIYQHFSMESPILPSLRALEIVGETRDEVYLLAMLQSRWESFEAIMTDSVPRVARLRSVVLRSVGEETRKELMGDGVVIQRLRSQGMDLRVELDAEEPSFTDI
uniref:F-box domain-containing protein n=1 Tax=Mycena chlorophos TaxID=658473 RepID=A0ABQ0LVP8_MYCCL|nr:predicted protein [Mycena chlorophos]